MWDPGFPTVERQNRCRRSHSPVSFRIFLQTLQMGRRPSPPLNVAVKLSLVVRETDEAERHGDEGRPANGRQRQEREHRLRLLPHGHQEPDVESAAWPLPTPRQGGAAE